MGQLLENFLKFFLRLGLGNIELYRTLLGNFTEIFSTLDSALARTEGKIHPSDKSTRVNSEEEGKTQSKGEQFCPLCLTPQT